MKKKYLKFNAEQLLEDKEFVSWSLYGTHNNEWDSFLSENPDFNIKAQEAKEIILLLKDKYDKLDEVEVHTLWNTIKQYNTLLNDKNSDKLKTSRLSVRNMLRFAAVFIMLVALGISVVWYFTSSDRQFKFVSGDLVAKSGIAKLVLQNGDVIDLKKDNSSVEIKSEDEILVNKVQSVSLKPPQLNTDKVSAMNELVIPYGKKSLLVLNDSTKVWLCAGSRLAFPSQFTGTRREVFLEGEAYFDVAHDPEKPFIVNAKEISLKVLGTRFYLSAYSSDKEITTVLLEGNVSLHDNSLLGLARKETVLKPGQKAIYSKSNNLINISQEADLDFYIAWTEGWFLFSKESLLAVFNKLERYYNIRFIYDQSFPSDDLISGKLDLKDSIEEVLLTLSDLAKISYKIENENIYIKKTKMN